jgi:LysR family transcriptional regulator, chromosome initiation inhibitor
VPTTRLGKTVDLISADLLAFAKVAECQTVHGAARALNLTQSAVTSRIHRLEEQMQATLFLRSRQGMRLTEQGLATLKYFRQCEALTAELAGQLAGEDRGSVRLSIQGPSSVMRSRIIPFVCSWSSDYPNIVFEFKLADTIHGIDALKQGSTDIAIVEKAQVVLEVDSKILKPEKYVLVASPTWQGRDLKQIVRDERIIDFDPSDEMTHRFLNKYCLKDLAKAKGQRSFANNTDAIASLVASGMGYTVLAFDFARPLIDRGELMRLGGSMHYDYSIALAWYPRRHPPKYFKSLVKSIK